MRRSVARSVDDAVRAFAKPDCSRAKWATEHPGQAVLCVSQAFWTLDVERVRAVGSALILIYVGVHEHTVESNCSSIPA